MSVALVSKRVQLQGQKGSTYDLGVVVLVDEHVLEVEIVAVERELLGLAAAAIAANRVLPRGAIPTAHK